MKRDEKMHFIYDYDIAFSWKETDFFSHYFVPNEIF